jgi:DNA-binding NtrC family response regulator
MDKMTGRPQSILVVDDDPNILAVLEARLASAGYTVHCAEGGHGALAVLAEKPVDLMISDIRMPDMGGMELLKAVEKAYPGLPIIFLTAHGSIPGAVTAIREGAVDYLTKPFDGLELLSKIESITEKRRRDGPDEPLSKVSAVLWGGKSPAMRELYDLIERVAPRDVNVLLLGESGTGKEKIANLIHQLSPRARHPFVVVDCGSTPAGLLESELFGHIKGSFTHALRDKKGLIEEAGGGTLFLDEIGNISQEMQVRLLRFLESRRIRRIGDVREIAVDCRVIAATNADLAEDVESGRFREDLYYRLKVVTVKVPPLRQRKEDIPLLASRFLEAFCRDQNQPPVVLAPEMADFLQSYHWPGNVRELKNALEAGVVLCKGNVLRPSDLQLLDDDDEEEAGVYEEQGELSLDESERKAIIRALEKANYVQKDAAPLLGVSRRALNYKIQKYGIDLPGKRSRAAKK